MVMSVRGMIDDAIDALEEGHVDQAREYLMEVENVGTPQEGDPEFPRWEHLLQLLRSAPSPDKAPHRV